MCGNLLWLNLKCCLSEYIPNYQWRVSVVPHCPNGQVLFLHNLKDYPLKTVRLVAEMQMLNL